MSNVIEFWGSENDERLSYDNMDEAIESILEDSGETTGTLEICGFTRVDPPTVDWFASEILECALENLDCDLGDPEGGTDPTSEMIEASKTFATELLKEYKIWACEVIERKTIDINKWIKENNPEWLKGD